MIAEKNSNDQLIAWCGWEINVPVDWRPLKVEGDFNEGAMMIGNVDGPVMRIKWTRPSKPESFDARAWIDRTLKKSGLLENPDPPRPSGFDEVAWVKDTEKREGESSTAWYGHSVSAGMTLQVITVSLTPKPLRRQVLRRILPALRVANTGAETRWSVFNVGFTSPAGFALRDRHLYSGDIALRFERDDGASLLLRQVYPAGLALERRKPERWLAAGPFKERRRLYEESFTKWHRSNRHGTKRRGMKRVPFPLGFLRPRYSTAIVVNDNDLDRLLIVEALSKQDDCEQLVEQAIEKMNIKWKREI